MATTIQVSDKVKESLDRMKLFERESYNEVIERVLEDDAELSIETLKDMEESLKQMHQGKVRSHEDVKKRLGL